MGHLVNILMPSIFAKKHEEFLEQFFQTGYKTVFDVERTFFGLHRNGYCICIMLMVKQIPSLAEGLQYVGMMREVDTDSDFILTDPRGIIDSFSLGISSTLNLSPSLFKENEINIQILAPDLIRVFNSKERKKPPFKKVQENDGQLLPFIVPKDFSSKIQAGNRKGGKDKNKLKGNTPFDRSKKGHTPIYWSINDDLNRYNEITNKQGLLQQLMQSHEYKDYEIKKELKCEMQDFIYGEHYKSMKPLKLRVLKISGIDLKKSKESERDMDDTYDEYTPSASNFMVDFAYVKVQEER